MKKYEFKYCVIHKKFNIFRNNECLLCLFERISKGLKNETANSL